jgi:hypothetical protein
MRSSKINREILGIALEALENRRTDLASKIAVVRQALGSNNPSVISNSSTRRIRRLSAAARRRIAEAQRKRWRLARQKGFFMGMGQSPLMVIDAINVVRAAVLETESHSPVGASGRMTSLSVHAF